MIVSTANTTKSFVNSPVCTGESYPDTGSDIDGAVIRVTGRYPTTGFLVNEVCKELVYITEGAGILIGRSGTSTFTQGDVIFIDNREEFAWDGNFVGFFATTPTFDPAQHNEVLA